MKNARNKFVNETLNFSGAASRARTRTNSRPKSPLTRPTTTTARPTGPRQVAAPPRAKNRANSNANNNKKDQSPYQEKQVAVAPTRGKQTLAQLASRTKPHSTGNYALNSAAASKKPIVSRYAQKPTTAPSEQQKRPLSPPKTDQKRPISPVNTTPARKTLSPNATAAPKPAPSARSSAAATSAARAAPAGNKSPTFRRRNTLRQSIMNMVRGRSAFGNGARTASDDKSKPAPTVASSATSRLRFALRRSNAKAEQDRAFSS